MNPLPSQLVILDWIRNPWRMTRAVGEGLQAGGCPAASNFLLLRQKKVTKEKATRLSGSLRFAPGNLRCSITTGVGRTRFAQTTAALDTASICAARPGQTGFGGEAGFGEAGSRKARPRRCPLPHPTPPPVGLGRGAQAKADQGERLSERSEFELDPAFAEHRRLPRSAAQGTQTIGSPFFWVLFFGDAKKSASPAGARPGLLEDPQSRKLAQASTGSARTAKRSLPCQRRSRAPEKLVRSAIVIPRHGEAVK